MKTHHGSEEWEAVMEMAKEDARRVPLPSDLFEVWNYQDLDFVAFVLIYVGQWLKSLQLFSSLFYKKITWKRSQPRPAVRLLDYIPCSQVID
jgi:hypothetical protein